jgi:hypothetical protein
VEWLHKSRAKSSHTEYLSASSTTQYVGMWLGYYHKVNKLDLPRRITSKRSSSLERFRRKDFCAQTFICGYDNCGTSNKLPPLSLSQLHLLCGLTLRVRRARRRELKTYVDQRRRECIIRAGCLLYARGGAPPPHIGKKRPKRNAEHNMIRLLSASEFTPPRARIISVQNHQPLFSRLSRGWWFNEYY